MVELTKVQFGLLALLFASGTLMSINEANSLAASGWAAAAVVTIHYGYYYHNGDAVLDYFSEDSA